MVPRQNHFQRVKGHLVFLGPGGGPRFCNLSPSLSRPPAQLYATTRCSEASVSSTNSAYCRVVMRMLFSARVGPAGRTKCGGIGTSISVSSPRGPDPDVLKLDQDCDAIVLKSTRRN